MQSASVSLRVTGRGGRRVCIHLFSCTERSLFSVEAELARTAADHRLYGRAVYHRRLSGSALDRNEQGIVGILVKVDAAGAVRDCVIERSSGSAALDAQTCRLVWLRAKFKPAEDATGRAVPGEIHSKINWHIAPTPPGPSEAWERRWIVSSSNGQPSCRVEVSGALKSGDGEYCPPDAERLATQLAGHPSARFVLFRQFTVGAPPKPREMASDDRSVGRQVAQLDVDLAGNLASCRIVETAGQMLSNPVGLCPSVGTTYTPLRDATGRAVPFTAYYAITAYLHGN